MIRSTFKLAAPKDAECTLAITMTLGEWESLRSQLPNSYPSWRVVNVITDLIQKARAQFQSTGETETP
jgi:hypothetical protein